jgi:hypothetical protein
VVVVGDVACAAVGAKKEKRLLPMDVVCEEACEDGEEAACEDPAAAGSCSLQ